MAILTIIEALKVEVIIGDQALPEHIDESEPPDDPNHIVVFVEIAEPSYFGVRCNLPKGFSRDLNDVQQSISVDGGKSFFRNLDKQVCEKGDHTTLIDRVSYTEHGEAESGRLKFAPLDIGKMPATLSGGPTSIDSGIVEQVQGLRKEDLPKFKGLGEIVITLHRVRKVARREQPALPWQNSKKTLSESSVPEKGLEWRALSHGVRSADFSLIEEVTRLTDQLDSKRVLRGPSHLHDLIITTPKRMPLHPLCSAIARVVRVSAM